jgi:histidine ammonia-lyase
MIQLQLGGNLTFADLKDVVDNKVQISLSDVAISRIQKGKKYLDGKLTGNREHQHRIWGVVQRGHFARCIG